MTTRLEEVVTELINEKGPNECEIIICKQEIYKEGLCKVHYEIYLDRLV